MRIYFKEFMADIVKYTLEENDIPSVDSYRAILSNFA